jgi:hypothetical protein
MSKKIEPPSSYQELPQAVIKQMLVLATSGFGLVAALAWNEVVKEVVDHYIKPYFPDSYGLISLIIYAFFITFLAVAVTLQLSRLQAAFEKKANTQIKKEITAELKRK